MATDGDHLAFAIGMLGLVVAAIHLWWGLPRFALYVTVGQMADPRPLAFVLSGHAIVAGITLAALGLVDRRRLYLPGAILMLVHLVGYVAWHTVLGHGVGGTAHEQLSLVTTLPIVLVDLWQSPLALAAAAAEVSVLVLAGVGYVTDESE